MEEPAKSRFFANPDLLANLADLVHDRSLHPLLLTSKPLAAAVVRRSYRTIIATPPAFLKLSDHLVEDPAQWAKSSALKHVRKLSIPTHSESTCPGLGPLPDLPNLEHIDLCGGSTTLRMGTICQLHSCGMMERYGSAIQEVTKRNLHLMPQMTVSRVTVILRACQFPHYDHRRPTHSAGTFGRLAGVDQVDIVLWDADHRHRIDWVDHPDSSPTMAYTLTPIQQDRDAGDDANDDQNDDHDDEANTAGGAPRGHRQPRRTRGCTYCDQTGCSRFSVDVANLLPPLIYSITRWTTAKEIRVWNYDDRACEKLILTRRANPETALSLYREEIKTQAERGREIREDALALDELTAAMEGGGLDAGGSLRIERLMRQEPLEETAGSTPSSTKEPAREPKVQVELGTAIDYIQRMRAEGKEVEDMEYWSMRLEDCK